jgi:hypothetical protein
LSRTYFVYANDRYLFPIISGKLRKLYAEQETGNMIDLKVNKNGLPSENILSLWKEMEGGGRGEPPECSNIHSRFSPVGKFFSKILSV